MSLEDGDTLDGFSSLDVYATSEEDATEERFVELDLSDIFESRFELPCPMEWYRV